MINKIKIGLIVIMAIVFVLAVFILIRRSGIATDPVKPGDIQFRELLCQIQEDTVYRWTNDGIVSEQNGDWLTYIVDCSVQMEPLNQFSLNYTYNAEHLIVSFEQDGKFINYQKLSKGTHTVAVPPNSGYLYISVHKEDLPALQLKNQKKIIGKKKYAGRYLSVLGDSISSYQGYIPEVFYPEYDKESGLAVSDMWWYQLAARLGMNICRINACAGSGVVNIGNGTGGNEERCVQLHTDAHEPDMILVLLGANDFFARIGEAMVIQEYREMVNRMQERYPDARIVLCTYYHPSRASFEVDQVNQVIKRIGKQFGLEVISLDQSGIEQEDPIAVYYDFNPALETGFHPNALGHMILSNYLYKMLTNEGGNGG